MMFNIRILDGSGGIKLGFMVELTPGQNLAPHKLLTCSMITVSFKVVVAAPSESVAYESTILEG